MKFTHSWLLDHLKTSASPKEIEDTLVSIGLEVEDVINPGEALKGFVVAFVEECTRHPNADRLSLCKVNDGSGTLLQVVCGAPNVRQGLTIAFAKPGCKVPSTGDVLKKGSIRGIESQGMICSAKELCIGSESSGIMELDNNLIPGTELATALGLTDCIYDISITPNRSDCFNIRGIARDLAAKGLGEFIDHHYELKSYPQTNINISIEETDKCSFYSILEIDDIKNHETPEWIKSRLESVGQKSISALVDIANYVMLDLGHPLHIFDADKIKSTITIRNAKNQEPFHSLGEVDYSLINNDLVIADEQRILCLAGIKGGIDSGVTEQTKRIYIEAAYFDQTSIAKSGQHHKIFSDARARFERGIDPKQIEQTRNKAAALIVEHCLGQIIAEKKSGTLLVPSKKIELTVDFFEKKTGQKADVQSITSILQKLCFDPIYKDQTWTITVPSFRHDLSCAENIIEEILRIQGYDNIPTSLLPLQKRIQKKSSLEHAKELLCHRGLDEVYTFSMIDHKTAILFDTCPIDLIDPLTIDLSTLRPSILPSLLTVALSNKSKSLPSSAIFEVAPVFKNKKQQMLHIAALRIGKTEEEHWLKKERTVDPYDAKADFLSVLMAYNISDSSLQYDNTTVPSYYHPKRSTAVKQGNKILGYFGELHPKVLKSFDTSLPVAVLEIFVENLLDLPIKRPKDFSLSVFQPVYRDFAFVCDKSISYDKLFRAIKKIDQQLIQDITVFDVYEGDKISSNERSIALRVKIQSHEKTLTDDDLQSLQEKIIDSCAKAGGILRQ